VPDQGPGASRSTARFEEWFESDVINPIEDFSDPSQEWRRLFPELLGTFFLVLVAAGGGMMGQAFPDTIDRGAAVIAPGLMVPGGGRAGSGAAQGALHTEVRDPDQP
jgi:hypothetical protein